MTLSVVSERLQQGRSGPELLPQLLLIALEVDFRKAARDDSIGESPTSSVSRREFLASLLKATNQFHKTSETAIVRGSKGHWRTSARSGPSINATNLPIDLLAESLDSESTVHNGTWSATPMFDPRRSGNVLLVAHDQSLIDSAELESTAAAIQLVSTLNQSTNIAHREAHRLDALLEITSHWNQSRNTDELLEQIAMASTRLLAAERATIFLPDATGNMLIGKPALGVEGNELLIPADAGLVGQVMQSGQADRVDAHISAEQSLVNRDVDQQLGFETRTLLCVPMINQAGKTIGAFEVINRNHGNFTDEDETALAQLAAHAVIALEQTRHVEHLETSKRNVAEVAAEKVHLIGQCPEIESLKKTIAKVANTELAVLITGENGTGKEVVAQMIHYLSDRRDEVLVAVNCAAISETLLESELFGHEKGAFTDAHQARAGKFELADGGTLFLDEIGDMSPGGQSKLLRVLEEKVVVRVGGSTPIPTSARIIAATNQDLPKLVSDKQFRQDLYFRLNVVTIDLPPLRERGDDVLLLAEHFLEEFCSRARRQSPTISPEAKKRLRQHAWPGNIRELRNLMERLAYLSEGNTIEPEDLAFVSSPVSEDSAVAMDQPLTDATRQFQIDYIERHIKRASGNMTDAAQRMGLHRSNLYRKMRQLGMSGDEEE